MLGHLHQPDRNAPRSAASDKLSSPYRLTPNVRAEAAERRRMARDLGVAMRDGTLLLQFQPRLALNTGRALGAQALIRWPHRKRGLVPPAVFLRSAEQSGQMEALGIWALTAACRAANRWPAPLGVSLAVPLGRIATGTLPAQVAAALEASGLAPERLEISLGEAVLHDIDGDGFLILSAIRDLGVGVALDDFGGALASLAMLRRLPLTAMKLDRSLMRGLPASREDAAFVRAAIDVSRALGLASLADGVDTEPQRAFLAGAGCEQGQGHLFGAPAADCPPARPAG